MPFLMFKSLLIICLKAHTTLICKGNESYSSYQSPQLADLSQHINNPKSLVTLSLLSMTLSTNLQFHPESAYKQCIPSHLLPLYEDIQYIHYKSPVTTTQQPFMSHQQHYFPLPTSSIFN